MISKVTAERYYTPQQAIQKLDTTESGLRNLVRTGQLTKVVPPGKKHGLFVREEVDQLKREMDAWLLSRQATKTASAKFVKATPEDIPEAVALAEAVFGGHRTISVETRRAWLQKNPDIDYLLKQEGQIVGYFSIVPLAPETIEDLLQQRRFAKDLTADDILTYVPQVPVDLYGMAIGVRPGVSNSQKREWGRALIMGAMRVLVGLGGRGIIIRTIQAHSTKPDGIRLMRHMGFTETVPRVPGLHDFLIDVESSGLPFLVEYKNALQQWQEAHSDERAHRQAGGTRGKTRRSRTVVEHSVAE